VITVAEGDAADHAGAPLSRHLDAYEQHLHAKSGDPRRISMLRRRLERLARDCRFSKINKMSAGPIEQWLVEQADVGLAASTAYSTSLLASWDEDGFFQLDHVVGEVHVHHRVLVDLDRERLLAPVPHYDDLDLIGARKLRWLSVGAQVRGKENLKRSIRVGSTIVAVAEDGERRTEVNLHFPCESSSAHGNFGEWFKCIHVNNTPADEQRARHIAEDAADRLG